VWFFFKFFSISSINFFKPKPSTFPTDTKRGLPGETQGTIFRLALLTEFDYLNVSVKEF